MVFLFILLGVALVIQVLFFMPAFIYRTDKVTDFAYGLTFIILALVALMFNGFAIGNMVLFLMILAWAIRLIWYLAARISVMKKDARFDKIRTNFPKFLLFWLFQGFIVWVLLIPSVFYMNNSVQEVPFLSLLGLVIWGTGLLIETVADCQKFAFKNKRENRGRWISSGLWRYSRHPNYFGEWLVWVGIYVFTIPGLTGSQLWLGLISPVFILFILVFVSGIPSLERKYDERYKDNKEYQAYKRRTSIFIPWFVKD